MTRVSTQWRLTAAAGLATVLTALALAPTVQSDSWLVAVAVTVTAIGLAAGTARALSAPRWLVTLVAAAALVVTVTMQSAHQVAVLGFVPGPGAWERLGELARDGGRTIWEVAAPIPGSSGTDLLIIAGVGLVAVVVDAVAVTWRRPAAAGLPLLVLYLVPASVLPDGVPWPLFVLGGLGWVGLLLSDGRARLSSWGRVLSVRDDRVRPSSTAVAATGRRLAAVALTAAVAVPLVVPMLSEGILGVGGGGGSGPGDGSGEPSQLRRVVTINPLVDLRRDLVRGDDVPVLTYVTDDPTPSYLRIATLDQFDGATWTLEELQADSDQQASAGLPPPPGLTDAIARRAVITTVDVVGLSTPRLPLPYPPTRVAIDGDWRWDADSFDVFTAERGGSAQGTSYTADSLAIEPTVEQLRAADDDVPDELWRYTVIPPFTSTVLSGVTERVTGDAGTPYDQALAIQNWFRTKFDYSLERNGGNGLSDLQAFLADRSGYCEQFAATMALMARVAGIPSRVQVGFTPGTLRDDGVWEVTTHDAHAWPELWLNGVGWVRFEPTPGGGDGGGAPEWAPIPVTGGGGGGGVAGPTGPLRADDRRLPPDLPGRGATGDVLDLPAEQPGRAQWPFLLAALLVAAVAALLPAAVAAWVRRQRWRRVSGPVDAVEAGWQQVMDTALDLDLDPRGTETTRDLARRLPRDAALSSSGRAALAKLAGQVERVRYGSGAPPTIGVDEARGLADAVTDDLLASLRAADRRRARWWPASGRARVGELAGRLGRRVDRVLELGGRSTRWVSGRARRDGGPSALRSDA